VMRTHPRSLLALLALLGACGGPSGLAPVDSGPDAEPSDAGDDAMDALSRDAAIDAGTNGAGPLVAECQALAQNFETKCAGNNPRPCLWSAYVKLCATGQTQLLIDSMKCLASTTCRTFSDPNSGQACLAQVHANGASTAAKAFISQACSACGQSCAPAGAEEILPYLSDADLASLSGCDPALCALFGASDAGVDAGGCFANPDLAPFVACLR
jgi:hypothetical protein